MDLDSLRIGSEDPARLVEYCARLLGEPRLSDGTIAGAPLAPSAARSMFQEPAEAR